MVVPSSLTSSAVVVGWTLDDRSQLRLSSVTSGVSRAVDGCLCEPRWFMLGVQAGAIGGPPVLAVATASIADAATLDVPGEVRQ